MTSAEKSWNKQFAKKPYSYGKQANEFIRKHSHVFPSNSKIACFAEGEGRNAIYLAKKGYTVTTFDISTVGLKHTEQFAKQENVIVKTVKADLTTPLTYDTLFDGAILIFGHVHKLNQKTLFNNLLSAIKPGGILLIEVYSDKQLTYGTGGPSDEDFLYELNDLLDWIKDEDCLHLFYGEAERNEGTLHTGTGHIIQLIIKKRTKPSSQFI